MYSILDEKKNALFSVELGWCRYSSYGRHFTKLHLLEQVAQLLSFYLHDGDTVVDFSCGANAFVPLVKKEGRKQGLSIAGCAFDIITSQNLEDFQRCSWLDTHTGVPAAYIQHTASLPRY